MAQEEKAALSSSELMKLPPDPSDPNGDIWQLSLELRCLREQLEEFEAECRQQINAQMTTLEGLLSWCDSLLYQSCELYNSRKDPERR